MGRGLCGGVLQSTRGQGDLCTAQKVGAAGAIWRRAVCAELAARRCGPATRRACARTPMIEGRRGELPPIARGVLCESSPFGFRPRIGRLQWCRANESSATRCWSTSVVNVCPGPLVSLGVGMRRILCRLSPGWPATRARQHGKGETGVQEPCVVNKPGLGFRLPAFRTCRHALRPSHS